MRGKLATAALALAFLVLATTPRDSAAAHVYVGGYGDDALAVFARWRVYLPLVLRN